MQEFENGGLLQAHKPEIEIVAKQQKEYKKIGSMPLKPGHSLFSIHIDTLEVKKVEVIKEVAISIDGITPVKIQKTNFDPKLYYTSALNANNALRHYRKAINSYYRNIYNPKKP